MKVNKLIKTFACLLILNSPLTSGAQDKCNSFFTSLYSQFKLARESKNQELAIAIRKQIEKEDLRLAKEHNARVSLNLERYYVYPMVAEYIGENIFQDNSRLGHVQYFEEGSLALREIHIYDRLIYQNNELLTTKGKSAFSYALWDFVMLSDGSIYIFQGEDDVIHHSSVSWGRPIAAAGRIRVVSGNVELISTQTGHYLDPTGRFIQQVERELIRKGLDLKNITREYEMAQNLAPVSGNAAIQFNIPFSFFK